MTWMRTWTWALVWPRRAPVAETDADRAAGVSRRRILTTGAVALGGAAVGAGAARQLPGTATERLNGSQTVAFRGVHQAGITTPPQAQAALVSFDLRDGIDREALQRLMRIWTDDIERLTEGAEGLADTEPELAVFPARLTVTVGFGAGVFEAAELQTQRPTWLEPLPAFGIDQLQDRWNGGDVVLQVCGDDDVTVAHAVRLLTKEARTFVSVRWTQRGFRRAHGSTEPGSSTRNLMGQIDGTSNPDPAEDPGLVWVGDRSAAAFGRHPAWLSGGSSMVVRRIAMDLDTWDELDRGGREEAVGRRLSDGAPLTGQREQDVPDLEATNDLGLEVIGPFAHIRRARSDDDAQRFLRRPYNYDDAPDEDQLSNSGLLFITFQADVNAQYLPIQRRLDELDLLNEWTTPIGSAVFAILPGCRPGEYLGQSLLG